MPPVTLSAVVDLSKIKMKWKETYVSEGLNRKVLPGMPKGIYKGLRTIQNIASPRQVEVSAGADVVHAAVCHSADGFSTTFYDSAGVATILDLSSASLDNQETVIALNIVYTIGADTTADWIAYPITDWNALTDAQRGELIVVGTVDVPAAAANITTSMINMKRRAWAWESVFGDLPWSPLLKNTGFELAEVNATYTNAASYWTFVPGVNALWKVQQTDPRTGISALAMDHTAAGAQTASLYQAVGAPVTPGQLLKYQLYIKNLKVATGGQLRLWLRFVAADWVTNTDVEVVIPMTALDASYREISDTIAVPANCAQFVTAHIQHTLNQGTTGVSFRIDDFQVYLQANAHLPANTEDRSRQNVNTDQVIFEDSNDFFLFYYGNASMMRQSVNELLVERRDQNYTSGSPVELALRTAQITRLGSDLINTEARALLPRISVPVATAANINFTLLWESKPGALKAIRIYAGDLDNATVTQPGVFITVNARFDGTNWNKDINGTEAMGLYIGAGGSAFRFQSQIGATNSWLPGSWLRPMELTSAAVMTLFKDSGLGENAALLQVGQLVMDIIPKLSTNIAIDLGYERRGPVMQIGTSDVIGSDTLDPHGILVRGHWLIEEDFNISSLGNYVRQDITNVGSTSVTGDGFMTLSTNAANGSQSIIRLIANTGLWGTDGGQYAMGMRARIRIDDVTNSEQRIGFWAEGVGADPNVNANDHASFSIVNGVVSFTFVYNGVFSVPTGVTVTAGQIRWFSFNFSPVNGIVQWHISASDGYIQNGYVGGTYGEVPVSDIDAGDPARPFIGVKTTTASLSSIGVDYVAVWKNHRSAS